MRGHIHKRVRRNAAGKETVRWYVVVDVGIDAAGKRKQKWHGGFDTRREAEVQRAKIVNDLTRFVPRKYADSRAAGAGESPTATADGRDAERPVRRLARQRW